MSPRLILRMMVLVTAATIGLATPATAAEPTTKLVKCRAGHCLLISGQREHAGSLVRINGREVSVDGNRKWRVRLPVETVRLWSEPHARTIDVAVVDPVTGSADSADANLPIGLLGNVTDLAFLVIQVK
jgi:hypothetical protein